MGRRPHVDETKFAEFMDSVPDDLRHGGYWKIAHERLGNKGGGVIKTNLGFMQFQENEQYDELKDRVIDQFASQRGPATYYAIPCNERKVEIKNHGMLKIEVSDKEVDMPDESNNAAEVLRSMKKMQKDLMDMNTMKMQQEMLANMVGKKKEDDDDDDREIHQPQNPMSDMMMYKMMFDDGNKKGDSSSLKEAIEAKMQAQMAEMKALLAQNQGGSSKTDVLLEKLIEKVSSGKSDDMMALFMRQQEEREKERREEARLREEERKEERHRREMEMKEERRREEERRRDETRRAEEERRLERERFERQLSEERRRFEEEAKIRREEMKLEQEKAKQYSMEQQKLQFQFLSMLKDSKDNSLESTRAVVETLTGAGVTSMKTAQQAADAIMSIATRDVGSKGDTEKEKEGGFLDTIKDIAQIAGPLLGPYADADAKMKMLKSVGQISGLGKQEGAKKASIPPELLQAAAQAGITDADISSVVQALGQGQSLTPQGKVASKPKGAMSMISQYLKAYPILRQALIGNLRDNLGVDLYLPIVTGLDQPTLEGLMANLPAEIVMQEIKKVCTPEEQQLIDQNAKWFVEFRAAMIDSLKGDSDDDDGDSEDEDESTPSQKVVTNSTPAPAPAPAPVPTPAVTQPPLPQ